MDIHAIQGDSVTHVTTIDRGGKDDSPVFLISQARLERYWKIEAKARELAALIGVDNPGPDDIPACSTPPA